MLLVHAKYELKNVNVLKTNSICEESVCRILYISDSIDGSALTETVLDLSTEMTAFVHTSNADDSYQ